MRFQSKTAKIIGICIAVIFLYWLFSKVAVLSLLSKSQSNIKDMNYCTVNGQTVPFRHLDNDLSVLNSSPVPAQQIVFDDREVWKKFWRQYGHGWLKEPDLDFSRNVMAGVFLGEKAPGYDIE